ncbi:hypothetical protein HYFRA_00000002 [Hymenoscyphus fraxineus]|uniref:Azaphilone pigments biosynthesis cluster protein L N-terminal domain-containing protein n=1 Tax=Hymenoscyphus fraxineus TaxID=746836 RepID=A0A9N9PXI4_9HELO|nr:hypothetical protein HYFRA_00000002 [Hymenoscyphus fraxineus]
MDPLSITATCLTLLGTIAKVSITITSFVRDVRGARSELDGISRELVSLKVLLESIHRDVNDSTGITFPEILQRQIAEIVGNCALIVEEVQKTLEVYQTKGITKAARWALVGKEKMSKLQASLGAHKSALDIALQLVNLSSSRDIKADTRELQNDTMEIKRIIQGDAEQILGAIRRLQLETTSGFMMGRYLGNLESYAGTICDSVADDEEVDVLEGKADITDRRYGSTKPEWPSAPSITSLPLGPDDAVISYRNASSRPSKLTSPNDTIDEPAHISLDSKFHSQVSDYASLKTPSILSTRPTVACLSSKSPPEKTNENIILDIPQSSKILNRFPYCPKVVRLTATNCSAAEFPFSKFNLRSGHRFKTRILLCIVVLKRDDESPIDQAMSLIHTLRSVMKSVEYLNEHPGWGGNVWKSIVVGIVCHDTIGAPALEMLENIGIFVQIPQLINGVEIGSMSRADTEGDIPLPFTVKSKIAKAQIFEVRKYPTALDTMIHQTE